MSYPLILNNYSRKQRRTGADTKKPHCDVTKPRTHDFREASDVREASYVTEANDIRWMEDA